jgi:hypothetical protein
LTIAFTFIVEAEIKIANTHNALAGSVLALLIWAAPTQARFLQVDPVGYQDQYNLYVYVGDDPVNNTDPTGLVRCSNDARCETVHVAADEARAIALRGSSALRSLAGAVNSGAELTSDQRQLLGAFERKFGEGSGTASALNRVAGRLERIAEGIGERGSGMRIRFGGPSGARAAEARVGGNSMIIRPRFFTMSGSRSIVILHEGGHGPGGLRDRALPGGAPAGIGFMVDGVRRAYGAPAANWLGQNYPSEAARNNDNYVCLVHSACGD